MGKTRLAATLGISLLVVALVAAFAMSVANVAYAQTSKPVKVKVKTSTVAPVLKKDGPYHCSALKYGYRSHAGITDKWHREC